MEVVGSSEPGQGSPKVAKGFTNPASDSHRYTILFLICMVTFGSYFSYDVPGATVTQLLDARPENKLLMTALEYNLMYSLYAWPNVIIVFVGGYFIDLLGIAFSGVALMSLVTVGQLIMTAGAFVHSIQLLFLGRLIFASGAELLIVCQGSMIFKWFVGKEMALAFGFSLTLARLGSILCFAFLPSVAENHGIPAAFGLGSIFCVISFVVLGIYLVLDSRADRILQRNPVQDSYEEPIQPQGLQEAFKLSPSFWLCVSTLMTNYGCLYSFFAISIDFMHHVLGLPSQDGGYELTLVYNISMVLAPMIGGILDIHGGRGLVTFFGAATSAILFCSLSWMPPLAASAKPAFAVGTPIAIASGISLASLSSSVWPTIPIIVPAHQVGMAIGVAQSLQNFGVGVSTLGVGYIYDQSGSYRAVLIYLSGIAICSAVLGAAWNIYDRATDGIVNRIDVGVSAEEAMLLEKSQKVMVVEVAPLAVLVVRRKFYEDIGEGEIGMKRRDYYRSLGIADLNVASHDKSSYVDFVPPLLQNSSSSVLVPDAVEEEREREAESSPDKQNYGSSFGSSIGGTPGSSISRPRVSQSGPVESGLREALLAKTSRRPMSSSVRERQQF